MKPALGGLLLGVIGFFLPKIFGVGYGPQPVQPSLGGLELALLGRISLGVAIACAALKLLATSLTIGSGGSGGIFSPSLFIGAATANAFGQIAHRLCAERVASGHRQYRAERAAVPASRARFLVCTRSAAGRGACRSPRAPGSGSRPQAARPASSSRNCQTRVMALRRR